MKKILIGICFLFLGLQGHSQVLISIIFGDKLNSPNLEFGLEGGVNWSNMTKFQSGTPLATFNLGFYFDFRIKNNFFLYTGVLVKSKMGIHKLTEQDVTSIGSSLVTDSNGNPIEGDYRQELNYFLVPVLAKYRWKNNIYVEGGIQAGLLHKAWVEFNADIDGLDAVIKDYNGDSMNKLDVGPLVGVGYKFKKGPGWSIGVKYYYGLVDVYKNISGTKNSSFFLKANIPIGAGKKKENSEK